MAVEPGPLLPLTSSTCKHDEVHWNETGSFCAAHEECRVGSGGGSAESEGDQGLWGGGCSGSVLWPGWTVPTFLSVCWQQRFFSCLHLLIYIHLLLQHAPLNATGATCPVPANASVGDTHISSGPPSPHQPISSSGLQEYACFLQVARMRGSRERGRDMYSCVTTSGQMGR